jgi:hypothetical protein
MNGQCKSEARSEMQAPRGEGIQPGSRQWRGNTSLMTPLPEMRSVTSTVVMSALARSKTDGVEHAASSSPLHDPTLWAYDRDTGALFSASM